MLLKAALHYVIEIPLMNQEEPQNILYLDVYASFFEAEDDFFNQLFSHVLGHRVFVENCYLLQDYCFSRHPIRL